MIKISYIDKIDSGFNEKTAQKTSEEAMSLLGLNGNLLLEIILVDKSEIKELNNKFRNIDKATDVLSFPQTQLESSKLNILGSIVICPEIAKEREEGIPELIKHGILHLAGFDHETDEEKWSKAAKKINHKL